MTAAAAHPSPVATRSATAADNEALLALADACPMEGAITLRIDRRPDFFALGALEPEQSRVEVIDGDDGIVGCIAIAVRTLYLGGTATSVSYVGDLKVHPRQRTRYLADALIRRAIEVTREIGGDAMPVLCSVLAGNRAMERRVDGGPDLPALSRIATVRAHSIPLLWNPTAGRSRAERHALRVRAAGAEDAEAMAALWRVVARERQLAPALDARAFARWMAVPGVRYRLARRPDGRLAGFMARWDQSALKRLRVLRYAPSMARFRAAFNLAAPLLGATRLPAPGESLRDLTALHVCVPAEEPAILRALVRAAHEELRAIPAGEGLSFFTIALDVRDPLGVAMRGLLAQPTDIDIRLTSPSGRYAGPALDARPVHYETALV